MEVKDSPVKGVGYWWGWEWGGRKEWRENVFPSVCFFVQCLQLDSRFPLLSQSPHFLLPLSAIWTLNEDVPAPVLPGFTGRPAGPGFGCLR